MLECDWAGTTDYCQEVGSGKGMIPQKRDTVRRYQRPDDMEAAITNFGADAEGVVSLEAERQAAVFASK